MKKLVALMAALVMLLSFAAAEETAVATYNFDEMVSKDLQETLGKYDVLTVDFPVKIWVPNDTFVAADASEVPEEYATGHEIGMFKFAADESLIVVFTAIPNDTSDFDSLLKSLREDKDEDGNFYFTDVQEAVINGVRAVSYKVSDDEKAMYATYEVSDDMWLNIMFLNSENEAYTQAAGMICMSVTTAD